MASADLALITMITVPVTRYQQTQVTPLTCARTNHNSPAGQYPPITGQQHDLPVGCQQDTTEGQHELQYLKFNLKIIIGASYSSRHEY